MKTIVTTKLALGATLSLFLFACQKNDLSDTASTDSGNTIAVAATATAAGGVAAGGTDSVYLVQPCGRGGRRESIVATALPSSAQTYLDAQYSGASFHKAFVVKNSNGTVANYVAVVYYNNKPVGLLFDASGNFVRVLEQRERGDLNGPGFHRGGRFEHRDGQGRDSIALAALPGAISAYFAANYSTDTLVKAFRAKDSAVVVLSKNNGVYATVFTASHVFVKRDLLPVRNGACQAIEFSAVPTPAANYLAQTYPNYVFQKAFALIQGGTVKGYLVFIDANNSKYAVEFDVAGNFVRSKTVH